MNNKTSKKEYMTFFLTGCLLGALCFVAIYGIKILDFTYDAWLLKADVDLMQHYIGWGHFRNSEWTFPIGLISTLSYPYDVSVIYTDSIPVAAVFFKLLSPILPETFQYFGMYGIISFMLMGGFSTLLIGRFVKSRAITVISSIFFIASFPMIQRMFYHTALASQWLIILALVIWVYGDIDEPVYKKCIKWGIMGFLCVGIHSYFLPMVGAIMLFDIIDGCIENHRLSYRPVKIMILEGLLEIASFCGLGIVNLWILGGFYGDTSAIGGGIGTFESNLNTFFNPMGLGITGITFPVYYDFQYEGFAYLGLGMLILLIMAVLGIAGLLFIERPKLSPVKYFREHYRQFLMLVLFALFVILASGPIFTFGGYKIIGIPLPGVIGKIADIFRSNGRFIWVSFYVLMLAVIVIADRIMRKSMKMVILVAALIIQIIDISPRIEKTQKYFNNDLVYTSFWENEEVSEIIKDKKEFIIMESEMLRMMDSAYYAFKHDMMTNDFYYARNMDDKIDEKKTEYKKELWDGNAREDAVYLFLKEGFDDGDYPNLACYPVGDYVVGVREE